MPGVLKGIGQGGYALPAWRGSKGLPWKHSQRRVSNALLASAPSWAGLEPDFKGKTLVSVGTIPEFPGIQVFHIGETGIVST